MPEPGAGEVLIEIAQCGICGTDLHFVLGRIARPGTVLGHEWAGTIAAVGADVDGMGGRGPRRVRPEPGCGECRACRAGRPSVCLRRPPVDHLSFRGAFARYVVAPAAQLVAVPEHLPPRGRAHRADRGGDARGDAVGRDARRPRARHRCGPVGLLVTAVLHAQGIATSPSRSRRRCGGSVRGRWARRGSSARRAADAEHGRAGAGALHGGVRVLGQRGGRRVGDRAARLRGRVRAGGHRPRVPPPQPQPCDRAREHDHRCLQLRRRRVRVRARAAGVGRDAARRADRAGRRVPRRAAARHAALRGRRAAGQGDGPAARSDRRRMPSHERSQLRAHDSTTWR